MRKKTQLVASRGEAAARAAEEQAAATAGGEPLTLGGLPAAARSMERVATAQAATYEAWAADISGVDPLLGRSLAGLAGRLRALAGQAGAVREEARDALRALDDADADG